MPSVRIERFQLAWNTITRRGRILLWAGQNGRLAELAALDFSDAADFSAVAMILAEEPAYFETQQKVVHTGQEEPGN